MRNARIRPRPRAQSGSGRDPARGPPTGRIRLQGCGGLASPGSFYSIRTAPDMIKRSVRPIFVSGHAEPSLLHVACRQNGTFLRPGHIGETGKPEEVNCVETVLEQPILTWR